MKILREGGAKIFLDSWKRGFEKIVELREGLRKFVYFKTNRMGGGGGGLLKYWTASEEAC